jgi:sulfoxide reductase heme-binding subunit YedZ
MLADRADFEQAAAYLAGVRSFIQEPVTYVRCNYCYMDRLKFDRLWVVFNLLACVILLNSIQDWNLGSSFGPILTSGLETGKWALRFLLVCLAMTPLRVYMGWNRAIKLRKPAGLWAFGFAVLHIAFTLWESQSAWLRFPLPLFILLGILSIVILTALALSSNRWSMRRLGKSWKRLHRLVYLAGVGVIAHALLAASVSKKMIGQDPMTKIELQASLIILFILLVLRLPYSKKVYSQLPGKSKKQEPTRLGTITWIRPIPSRKDTRRVSYRGIRNPARSDRNRESRVEREPNGITSDGAQGQSIDRGA